MERVAVGSDGEGERQGILNTGCQQMNTTLLFIAVQKRVRHEHTASGGTCTGGPRMNTMLLNWYNLQITKTGWIHPARAVSYIP